MAERTDEHMENNERKLRWLVRIAAVLVSVLLIVFFGMVIRTSNTIDSEVEGVKNGPYPVSVAAGHLETDLYRLKTSFEYLSTVTDSLDVQSKEFYADTVSEVVADMDVQLEAIQESFVRTPEKVEQFANVYGLLVKRMDRLIDFGLGESPDESVSFDKAASYIDANLIPVVDYLLKLNDGAIQSTTVEVSDVYDRVNSTLRSLFMVSLIMFVSVAAMMVIYMLLLRRLTQYENDLRDSLKRALQTAKDADAAKSMFLSNMSHDIRTPMNAIVGLTTIAQENIDDQLRVKQCLTRISTSSQHLLSLINDILDMNKIESGKVTLSREVFSLERLVDEIRTIAQSQPTTKKRNCTIEIDASVKNLYLMGDAMRLRQILLNLVSNALKYTNDGDSVRMTVSENPQPDERHASVTMVVEDTGIGMKQDFVKHIFEPFERERNDFTVFTEGTGLGMAITKNLVDLMDGQIKVDSELGVGTKVTITLVFEIAPEESRRRAEEAEKRAVGSGGSGAGLGPQAKVSGRVLLVEDNEINMEIAKQLISSRGAEVEEAVDGLEAYTKVSDSPDGHYDLIFMDWQMPHMNGIESTKAIRRFFDEHGRKEVPIVAMTANAFDSDRQKALAAGMADFMAKPIDVHQLEDVLHRYLD